MTIDSYGLEPAQTTDPRIKAWRLASGETLAFADAPRVDGEYPRETHNAAEIVQPVLKAFGALDKARRDARDDKALSDIGRLVASEPARKSAEAAVDKAREDLAAFSANVAKFEVEIFATPTLEPADVVGGLQDAEIREYLRRLPAGARGPALGDLTAQPRIIAAVLRSPIPIEPFSDVAHRHWRETVAATHPRAPELARFKAAAEWANSVLPLLAKRIGNQG